MSPIIFNADVCAYKAPMQHASFNMYNDCAVQISVSQRESGENMNGQLLLLSDIKQLQIKIMTAQTAATNTTNNKQTNTTNFTQLFANHLTCGLDNCSKSCT